MSVDFDNGQKNHWRKRLWNLVTQFVNEKRRAIVLYLAGPEDLDRLEAVDRRGFMASNLIAVERSKIVAGNLRKCTVIRADSLLVRREMPVTDKKCRAQIAAALALRTMRGNGQLRCA